MHNTHRQRSLTRTPPPAARGTPEIQVRKKTLEILSHINRRVRDSPAVGLPLPELCALFTDASTPPTVRNFAIVYVEMAFERAPEASRLLHAPALLRGVGAASAAHRPILLRLACWGFEPLANPNHAALPPSQEKALELYPFMRTPADAAAFVEFATDLALYRPPSQGTGLPVMGLAGLPPGHGHTHSHSHSHGGGAGGAGGGHGHSHGGEAEAAAPAAPAGPPPPAAGLSRDAAAAVEGARRERTTQITPFSSLFCVLFVLLRFPRGGCAFPAVSFL